MRLFGMSRLSVAYPKFKFRGFKKMATLPKIVKELISADKVFSTADNNQQSLMFDCICYAVPLACDLANTHEDIKNYNFDIPQAKTVKVDFNKKHFNGLVENTRKKISMEVFYLVTKHGAELAKLRTGDKVKSWLVKNYSDKKTKVKSYRTLASQTKKEKNPSAGNKSTTKKTSKKLSPEQSDIMAIVTFLVQLPPEKIAEARDLVLNKFADVKVDTSKQAVSPENVENVIADIQVAVQSAVIENPNVV